jgi:hypothetical protein
MYLLKNKLHYGYAPGIETTTGPLGQGITNGVGFAMAEKLMADQFNNNTLSEQFKINTLMEQLKNNILSEQLKYNTLSEQ